MVVVVAEPSARAWLGDAVPKAEMLCLTLEQMALLIVDS